MPGTLQEILTIALGAAIGANGRYWVGHFTPRVMGEDFPYATNEWARQWPTEEVWFARKRG